MTRSEQIHFAYAANIFDVPETVKKYTPDWHHRWMKPTNPESENYYRSILIDMKTADKSLNFWRARYDHLLLNCFFKSVETIIFGGEQPKTTNRVIQKNKPPCSRGPVRLITLIL